MVRLKLLTAAVAGGAAVALSLVALPTSALAAGGDSIANAPTIRPGVKYFANTATDPTDTTNIIQNQNSCSWGWANAEYWLLPLTAGSQASIYWQVPGSLPEGSTTSFLFSPAINVAVFPPGTTDANVTYAQATQNWLNDMDPCDAPTGGSSFRVSTSGTYVLAVGLAQGSAPGPFSFYVTERSAVRIYNPRTLTTTGTGNLSAVILSANDTPITSPTLHLELWAHWRATSFSPPVAHLIDTATPSDGRATFHFHLPDSLRGSVIRMDITGLGIQWLPAIGPNIRVYVAASGPRRPA